MWTFRGQRIKEGRGWTDAEGIQHPGNWSSLWSDSEKQAKGLVWVDPPASYDNRFYWSAGNPKAIDDVTEDGVITSGLKSAAIQQTKNTAGSLLQNTDWYVTRKSETDVAIPTDVATYRAAVRTASNDIETAINAVTTHDAFMALYDADSDGISAINAWPEPLES